MRKSSVLLLLLVLLCSACQRDEGMDAEIRTPIFNPPSNPITGNLVGTVYEDSFSNRPISEATVWLGEDISTVTDADGQFSFQDVRLYENGTLVTVEKDGYFQGTKKFNAFEDEIHSLDIQLISREEAEFAQTSIGGQVSLGAAQLELPSGNYLSENSTYSGEMHIYGRWLDPTDQTTFSAFPGNQTGVNKDGELKALASFGILVLEVEGAEGQDIELPEGVTATLTMPIPDIMREFAQETLELWFFDEDNGTWVEDGVAFSDGEFYTAEVGHFAYWSINISFDEVKLSSQINIDGFPAVNRQVKIQAQDGFITFANTNSEGRLSLSVPEGKLINLIIDGDCLNTPYSDTLEQQFGDALQDDPIELTAENDEFRVFGKAQDCSGTGLDAGWIRIQYENYNEMLRTDQEGNFDILQMRCVDAPFSVYSIDSENEFISSPRQSYGANGNEISNLMSCNEIDFELNLSYTTMNWLAEWNESVKHTWEWSKIEGLDITILNITVSDREDNEQIFMEGAIRFTGDALLSTLSAQYLLNFPTQDLQISGIGEVSGTEADNTEFISYKFSGAQTNPAEGIADFTFDLVYFD